MTFVPASPEDAGSVTIVGAVDVSDRAARLLGHVTVDNASLAVTGPLTDAQFAARLPLSVSGPLTDAQLRASAVPVSGPLTDAQLRASAVPVSGTVSVGNVPHVVVDSGAVNVGNFPADQLVHFVTPISVTQGTSPWVVDGSAVTQPVSVASLPLPAGAATEATLGEAKSALNDVALTAILERDKMETE
jgi:hypothetical protein